MEQIFKIGLKTFKLPGFKIVGTKRYSLSFMYLPLSNEWVSCYRFDDDSLHRCFGKTFNKSVVSLWKELNLISQPQ